jgi:LPLT family lysophospholipid transporter-like MFS transporter
MKRGFYTIMAAQFFSSLADNALLIAAISLLIDISAPEWMTPLLKLFFCLSYVLLAAFVGAFADALPKGRVMFITNSVKIVGCMMMLFGMHPLAAYAVVGLGAAAYSPAKYGILTELLPSEELVKANGWIEGLTVGSIILGTVLGGQLVGERLSTLMLSIDVPFIDTGITTAPQAAIAVIACVYAIAALVNLRIPDTGVRYAHQERNPARLIVDFAQCFTTLWRDKLGQISLAVTTLFWGAGATLQFIVLRWAASSLGLDLTQGATLQAVVAIGIAAGAVLAARIPLKRALSVLPFGVAMGLLVMSLAFFHRDSVPQFTIDAFGLHVPFYLVAASLLLTLIGGLAGFFVVPMNALLQYRGHVLMSAGHSIAVQNFNENLSVLTMLCIYAVLVRYDLSVQTIIVLFGVFVVGSMGFVIRRHRQNIRRADHDPLTLIREARH